MKKHLNIQFTVNGKKAIEATLYVLTKRKKNGENVYNVLKALFEADKHHLNLHGRPVTGDTYIKMEYGTVPSAIKNIIDKDFITLAGLNIDEPPFKKGENHLVVPEREPDLDYLSESDIESLDVGIKKYLHLSFAQVRELNHQEKSWVESEMNSSIDFSLMIENEEIRKLLEESPLKIVV